MLLLILRFHIPDKGSIPLQIGPEVYRIGGLVHTGTHWIGPILEPILRWAGTMKNLVRYGTVLLWDRSTYYF